MSFRKYSAFYRNDDITINDENVIGSVKDIKEYFKYELASQCMSDLDYENLIDNGKMIFYLIEELENKDDDLKIKVYYNPMGALQYTTYINENEDNKRYCSICKKEMTEGYYNEDEFQYYCSDECLHKDYTDEEYNKLYDNGNGNFYYTSWEE